MAERESPNPPQNRWRDDRPPSARVLKLALIGAAIILIVGLLLYWKARHEPPALHDYFVLPAAPARAIPASPAAARAITRAEFRRV